MHSNFYPVGHVRSVSSTTHWTLVLCIQSFLSFTFCIMVYGLFFHGAFMPRFIFPMHSNFYPVGRGALWVPSFFVYYQFHLPRFISWWFVCSFMMYLCCASYHDALYLLSCALWRSFCINSTLCTMVLCISSIQSSTLCIVVVGLFCHDTFMFRFIF